MKKLTIILLFAVLVSTLVLSGCSSNTLTGSYYRDFGNYISSTMFVELKKDGTFEADGATDPNLSSEGTYEVDGTVITFFFRYFWDTEQDEIRTFTGTVGDGVLTVGDIMYRKQSGSSVSEGQKQEEAFRQGHIDNTEPQTSTTQSSLVDTSQFLNYTLPGYEKYPRSFSIFVAYAQHQLPLDWLNVKSYLTDAGYEFWHPYDDDETSGFMLFHNSDDEQEFYYEFATIFGGISNDGIYVDTLMYQLDDASSATVSFKDGHDTYTIRIGEYNENGYDYDEWEVSTLAELIDLSVTILNEIYERAFIS